MDVNLVRRKSEKIKPGRYARELSKSFCEGSLLYGGYVVYAALIKRSPTIIIFFINFEKVIKAKFIYVI